MSQLPVTGAYGSGSYRGSQGSAQGSLSTRRTAPPSSGWGSLAYGSNRSSGGGRTQTDGSTPMTSLPAYSSGQVNRSWSGHGGEPHDFPSGTSGRSASLRGNESVRTVRTGLGGLDPYGPARGMTSTGTAVYGSAPPLAADLAAPQGKPRVEGGIASKTGDAWKSFRARVKSDAWKVSVVKATNHAITEPKEKHVQVILRGTYWGGNMADKSTPAGAVFHQLRKRLLIPDWIVVLKALIVFHRIFQDGSGVFSMFLAQYASNIFQIPALLDHKSEGMQHIPLIHAYSQYLERWCTTKRSIDWPERPLEPAAQPIQQGFPGSAGSSGAAYGVGVNLMQLPVPGTAATGSSLNGSDIVRGPMRFTECDVLQLLDEVPLLQDNLDMLLAVRLDYGTANSAPARAAMRLCVRDIATLLPAYVVSMQNLVERFYAIDILDVLQGGFDLYRRYLDQDIGLSKYYQMCESISMGQQLPDVSRPSQEILDGMYDHIERVRMGDVQTIRGDELDGGELPESDHETGDESDTDTAEESQKDVKTTPEVENQNESEPTPQVTDASSDEIKKDSQPLQDNVAALRVTEASNSVDVATRGPPNAPAPLQRAEEQRESIQQPDMLSLTDMNGFKKERVKQRSAKPNEFDLLALLENSSDSDDQGDALDDRSSSSGALTPNTSLASLGLASDPNTSLVGREKSRRGSNRESALVPGGFRHKDRDPFTQQPQQQQQQQLLEEHMPPPSMPSFYGAYPPALAYGPYGMQALPPPPPASNQGHAPYPTNTYPSYGYPPEMPPGTQGGGGYPPMALGYNMPAPAYPDRYAMPQFMPSAMGSMASATNHPSYPHAPTTMKTTTTTTGAAGAPRPSSLVAERKITPADQHFFDLYEQAKPKKESS